VTKEEFEARVDATIEFDVASVLALKPDNNKYLTYADAAMITTRVRAIFRNLLGQVPSQIEAACSLAEATLAPSTTERIKHIKAAVGVAGGAAGVAMVIGGIGLALGWGAGVISAVVAFFAGASLTGPIGWIVGGVAIATIAGYFAFSGDEATSTERFINALRQGVKGAIPQVWDQHQTKLAKIPSVGGEQKWLMPPSG
jgi:hypothetical protein